MRRLRLILSSSLSTVIVKMYGFFSFRGLNFSFFIFLIVYFLVTTHSNIEIERTQREEKRSMMQKYSINFDVYNHLSTQQTLAIGLFLWECALFFSTNIRSLCYISLCWHLVKEATMLARHNFFFDIAFRFVPFLFFLHHFCYNNKKQ